MPVSTKRFADKLNPEFVKRVSKNPVPWGPLGYITYKRTYARIIESVGRTEEWGETVERCVNAILKYGGQYTQNEAEQFYEYVYNLKCVFPGRMLWQLGTATVERVGGDSLCNCHYTNVDEIEAFCFAFDELMLGGGVGFSILPSHVYKLPQVKGPISILRRDANDVNFIVPDNRRGWVELLRRVLKSYFETGHGFVYSVHCVRGKGERIKGFGGISSGPGELVKGISQICNVLNNRAGKHLRPIDALDIMNIIGSVVVSGNVRRSAMLAMGAADDMDYLQAKQWSRGVPNWRAMSNNSVMRSKFTGLDKEFWSGYEGEGEPYGLVNLDLLRSHGRLADGKNYRPDVEVEGVNPCVPAGTRILTRTGYIAIDKLVGQPVEVWNGEEWSEVQPRITGKNKTIYKVVLSDGSELNCTDNHKWCITKGFARGAKELRVQTKDLKKGMKLFKYAFPVLTGGEYFPSAYTHGFYCRDGYDSRGTKYALLYGNKKDLEGYLDTTHVSEQTETRQQVTFSKELPKKFYVPMNATIECKLQWLAGLLDADGCVIRNPNGVGLQISSIRKGFLQEIKLMLTTLGVASKIGLMHKKGIRKLPNGKGGNSDYLCQDCWRLLIGSVDVYNLYNRGLCCKRLNIPYTKPQRDAKRFVTVVEVKELTKAKTVYCFTETKKNRGTFEGIVTANCAEQSLANRESCDLYELFLPNLKDKKEFAIAAKLGYKAAKTVLQLPFSWQKSEDIIRKNQRIGLGVTGFCQSAFKEEDYTSVYKELEEYDTRYSKRIRANRSIKLTTCKPSGTVSLLPGVTPGVHPAYSQHYIRRIRFSSNDPLVAACRNAGYPIEHQCGFDGTLDYDTQIVSFPVDVGPNTIVAKDMSAIQQLEAQKFLQTYWCDNNVSVTVYYKKEELNDIKKWLTENYQDSVKTVSFLRHSDHGFKQAPYEEITGQQYEELKAKCKPIDAITESQQWDLVDSMECSTGVCPIK